MTLRRWGAILVLAALGASLASAQALSGTRVELSWSTGGERIEAALRGDFDGLLLGMAGSPSVQARLQNFEALRRGGSGAVAVAVNDLTGLLRRRIRLRADGEKLMTRIEFPERQDRDGVLVTLGAVAVIGAEVPRGAQSASFFASRAFREVELTSLLGRERFETSLVPGERSPALDLSARQGP